MTLVTPRLAGGEVVGLLGLAGAGPVRALADEGPGHEDLEQERGEGEVCLAGGKAATVSVAAAGMCWKLTWSGDARRVHGYPGEDADRLELVLPLEPSALRVLAEL